MRSRRLLALVSLLTLLLSGCGSGIRMVTASAAISVTITPGTAQSLDLGQTLALSATVTNDAASKGVTWSVSGGGSLSSTTGASITYTPPATAPAAAAVTITATSIADSTKSAAVSVSVSAAPVLVTSTPLPTGFVGIAYFSTLFANGGSGTNTYSITAGSLPPGIQLNGVNGALTGIPTAVGTYTFTAQVKDSASTPVTSQGTFTINVVQMAIAPVTLPGSVVGSTYPAIQLGTTGSIGTVTFAVASGAFPPGITISAGGVIAGSATAAGMFTAVVQATDSAGQTATAAETIVVAARLVFNNVTLPAATTGSAITNQQLSATGGTAPLSYALTAGSALPAGLSLSSTGVLSGTPTTAGTYTFSVTATDSGSTVTGGAAPPQQTATATITLQVNSFTITNTYLPGGISGRAYTATLQASGGTAPYTFAVTGGILPAGLTLNAATGAISGSPTATGVANLTLTATDAANHTATANLSITLAAPVAFPDVALPAGTVNTAIAPYTFAPTGGTMPYTFAPAAGSALPAGLTLTPAGVLSGTPTAAGNFTFRITATDSGSSGASAVPPRHAATNTVTLSVAAALSFSTTGLPGAIVTTAYSATIGVSGGQAPYSFALANGTNTPAGLTLAANGTLSGAPSAAGTFSFSVTVTDAAGRRATATLSLIVAAKLVFANVALPTANVGTLIANYTFAPTGGTSPYTFAVAAGTLPAGLTLTNGVLSGTPTAGGSYTFNVVATDSGSTTAASPTPARQTATATVTLTVNSLVITPTTLPNAVPGSIYTQTLTATGGTGPYTFTLASGSALPAGLSLDSSGAIVSGYTTAPMGTYTFTINVVDSSTPQLTGSAVLIITVSNKLSPGANAALLNGSYAFRFSGFTNANRTDVADYGIKLAGQLFFDGAGNVTGSFDQTDARSGYQGLVTFSGSYSLDTHNTGTLTFGNPNNSNRQSTMAITVAKINGGVAAQIDVLQFDNNAQGDDSLYTGGGVGRLQTTPSTPLGAARYVFSLEGETSLTAANVGQFGAETIAGYLTLDGSGNVTAGRQDSATYKHFASGTALTGTYTAPDAKGRGTITLNDVGGPNPPTNFVYYVVSPTQIYLLSIDYHGRDPGPKFDLLGGEAQKQQQTTFNSASFSGNVIGYAAGSTGGDGTTQYQSGIFSTVSRLQFDGLGTVTYSGYSNVNGTPDTMPTAGAATYTVGTDGRVTFTGVPPAMALPTLYLIGANTAVGTLPSTDRSGNGILRLEPQAATAISDGMFALQTVQTTAPSLGFNGNFNISNGTATEYFNLAKPDGPPGDRLEIYQKGGTETFHVLDSTAGLVEVGSAGIGQKGYVITGGKFVTFADASAAGYTIGLFEQ